MNTRKFLSLSAAFCILLLLALPTFGLTTAQLAALRADIAADPTLNALPNTGDGPTTIAFAYNLNAVPAFVVWRSQVSVFEVQNSAAWDWTRIDNLTVGKARLWEWLTRDTILRPSQANVRAGIDATWVGTQADLNVRAAVYVLSKRFATRAEKLFATGTGTDAVPATMTFEGNLSANDVYTARTQ